VDFLTEHQPGALFFDGGANPDGNGKTALVFMKIKNSEMLQKIHRFLIEHDKKL